MTKQNKMLLGIGAVVIAGYFVWTNRKKGFANAGGSEKSVLLDLYVGNNVINACKHTQRAPIGYVSGLNNPFFVGNRWFTNFEQQINYPNGIYSLYNPTNSLSGNWARIVNGVVTEVGTCRGNIMIQQ